MPETTLTLHPLPFGLIELVASATGLLSLRVLDDEEHPPPPRADADAAPSARAHVARAQRQLDEYAAGRRRAFDLDIDWTGIHGFARDALEAIRTIPFGETAGYGEVAILAGRPRAARAVGTACARTPISIVIPVHRVVRADGSLGEYGGRPDLKRRLLDLERGEAE